MAAIVCVCNAFIIDCSESILIVANYNELALCSLVESPSACLSVCQYGGGADQVSNTEAATDGACTGLHERLRFMASEVYECRAHTYVVYSGYVSQCSVRALHQRVRQIAHQSLAGVLSVVLHGT